MSVQETSDGRRIAPVYIVMSGEIMLDAPIDKVWPHLINYTSWQNYTVSERVAGVAGEEGEVVLLRKEEQGYVSPLFHARTIRIDPGRRIIWKTYRGKAGDDEGYFAFVDFILEEVGDKTRFRSTNTAEMLVAYRDESELTAFRKQREETAATVFASTRAKLKKLVESSMHATT
jgi:hypothetical protein